MTVATLTTFPDGTTYPVYIVSWQDSSQSYTIHVTPYTGIVLNDIATYTNPGWTTAGLSAFETYLTAWAASLAGTSGITNVTVTKYSPPASSALYP